MKSAMSEELSLCGGGMPKSQKFLELTLQTVWVVSL